jgi:hypothetical protein
MIGGQLTMARLYPGFIEQLRHLGAVETCVGEHFVVLTPGGTAYSYGGAVKEPRYFGVKAYALGRGLLEYCVRQCTEQFKNVEVRSNCVVQKLICRGGRVRGVVCLEGGKPKSIEADLVADAARPIRMVRILSTGGLYVPCVSWCGSIRGQCGAAAAAPLPRGERGDSRGQGLAKLSSNFFGGTASAAQQGSQNPQVAPLTARGAAPLGTFHK